MAAETSRELPIDALPRWRDTFRTLLRHRGFSIGLGLVCLIVGVAVLAPLLSPHDPYATSIINRRIPPIWFKYLYGDPKASWNAVLGTDKLGRDYLSRMIYGARISLTIGISVVIVSALIGTVLGVCAGFFGGRTDAVVMYLVTTRLAMPVILVALAVVALHGSSLKIIVIVLGLLLWDRFAIVLRAATKQIRSLEYVVASRAIGISTTWILWRDILPNILSPLVVVATIEFANAILYEAALSFLGVGVQPPLPSWGLMLAEAKEDIFFNPYVITIPGSAIFVVVLAVNMLGDGLRDLVARR